MDILKYIYIYIFRRLQRSQNFTKQCLAYVGRKMTNHSLKYCGSAGAGPHFWTVYHFKVPYFSFSLSSFSFFLSPFSGGSVCVICNWWAFTGFWKASIWCVHAMHSKVSCLLHFTPASLHVETASLGHGFQRVEFFSACWSRHTKLFHLVLLKRTLAAARCSRLQAGNCSSPDHGSKRVLTRFSTWVSRCLASDCLGSTLKQQI